jgi:Flp pilus assembly protein TadG
MSARMTLRSRLKRFAAAREGVAAVEFALVVGPFLFMIFAVLELALVFLLSTSLDTATERAARRIRTGEVQLAGESAQAFKTAVCSQMTWLSSGCSTSLKVDVRTFKQFADTNLPSPFKPCPAPAKGRCFDDTALLFEHGGPTDVVIVRTYYTWPLLTPFLNQALARLDGGVAVVMSTQTFRNEPYA